MTPTPEELAERDTLRAEVERLRIAEAEAMAVVMSLEGTVERLRAAIDKAVDMLGDAATVSDVASVSEILEAALAALYPESEANHEHHPERSQ